MINKKLFKTFKILLGKGRAFNLNGQNIENISKSFLKPFEELIRIFHKIALTPFLSENTYNKNNELKQDTINFETQFGIEPSTKTTLEERAKNAEAQFGLVGGQSWKYLESSIRNAGIDVRVVENIPERDLLSENLVQYGLNQFNSKDIEGNQIAMYGRSGFLVVANGNLQLKEYDEETDTSSIINKDPIKINDSSHLFLIEAKNGGALKITAGQLDILMDIILRIKPLDQVVLLNISII